MYITRASKTGEREEKVEKQRPTPTDNTNSQRQGTLSHSWPVADTFPTGNKFIVSLHLTLRNHRRNDSAFLMQGGESHFAVSLNLCAGQSDTVALDGTPSRGPVDLWTIRAAIKFRSVRGQALDGASSQHALL